MDVLQPYLMLSNIIIFFENLSGKWNRILPILSRIENHISSILEMYLIVYLDEIKVDSFGRGRKNVNRRSWTHCRHQTNLGLPDHE